jgi:hypothetical protein
MAEPTEDKRLFIFKARWQGLIIMAAGIGMLFNPITAPHAAIVIATGAGWSGGGTASKLARNKMK